MGDGEPRGDAVRGMVTAGASDDTGATSGDWRGLSECGKCSGSWAVGERQRAISVAIGASEMIQRLSVRLPTVTFTRRSAVPGRAAGCALADADGDGIEDSGGGGGQSGIMGTTRACWSTASGTVDTMVATDLTGIDCAGS